MRRGAYVWDDRAIVIWMPGGVLTVSVGHANPHVVAIVEQVKKLARVDFVCNRAAIGFGGRLAQISRHAEKVSSPTAEPKPTKRPSPPPSTPPAGWKSSRYGTATAARRRPWPPPPSLLEATSASAGLRPRMPPTAIVARSSSSIQCGLACRRHRGTIRTCTTGEIAAFMAETIIGRAGSSCRPRLLRALGIARCGLFICDEVQTAESTGDKWFGIEHRTSSPT